MILEMMNTPPELLEVSIIYLRIYFAGIFFVFIYNSGSSILRALGDSKRPLYYLIVCSVINIVLDLLMVLVFNMGVAGVAIATLIAQAVSSVLVTRALMKSENLCQFSLKKIRFHRQMLKAPAFYRPSGRFSVNDVQSVQYHRPVRFKYFRNQYGGRMGCLRKNGCDFLDDQRFFRYRHHHLCRSELWRRKNTAC